MNRKKNLEGGGGGAKILSAIAARKSYLFAGIAPAVFRFAMHVLKKTCGG
jgi:hypothetical protein